MSATRSEPTQTAPRARALTEFLRGRGGSVTAGVLIAALLLALIAAGQVHLLHIPLHGAELAVSAVLAVVAGGLVGSLVVTRRQMRRERDLYHALADG